MQRLINSFISRHVSLLIFSGIPIGLLSGKFASISSTHLSIILFFELFIACFKIKVEDASSIRITAALRFLLLRYFGLAIALYYLGTLVSPTLAIALLLLSLLPTGVTSPGFAGLFGANVLLVLSFVIVSSLSAPLYLPFVLEFLAGSSVQIERGKMLFTILVLVVGPTIVHLPFRRIPRIHSFMVEFNPMLIIPLVWLTTLVPISRYRDEILSSPVTSLSYILGYVLLYALYLGFGYLLGRTENSANQKSYLLASCIHNVTLGVVLSFLYLPSEVSRQVVFANVSLILVISLLRGALSRLVPQSSNS
ncbi:MAG: hypothetical protein KDD60_10105 [Bdellovibrionales bacterium]|nr:hypothetical protein [Bdellovibrionales bacterium]